MRHWCTTCTVCNGKAARKKVPEKASNLTVLSFYHGVSRNIKSLAIKLGMSVVFRNDFNMASLMPFSKDTAHEYSDKHMDKTIYCKKGAVYEILLTCTTVKIGESIPNLERYRISPSLPFQRAQSQRHRGAQERSRGVFADSTLVASESNSLS